MKQRAMIAAAAMTLALTANAARAQDIGLELGTIAPGAAVETLDGKAADLAQFVGKTPVVMQFWATWCSNCKELEPTIKDLDTRYGQQVKFISVAVSVNQTPERVKAFVETHKLPGEHFFDRRGAATGAYDAPATSYVLVLDKDGKVVYTGLGGRQPQLENAIKRALGGG